MRVKVSEAERLSEDALFLGEKVVRECYTCVIGLSVKSVMFL